MGRRAQSDDIYFEILHLQPISLNLSFMRTERVNGDDKVSSRNPLIFLFNALTMALGNVNEAPVRLNALVIENVRLSNAVLQQRIIYHYSQAVPAAALPSVGLGRLLGNRWGCSIMSRPVWRISSTSRTRDWSCTATGAGTGHREGSQFVCQEDGVWADGIRCPR